MAPRPSHAYLRAILARYRAEGITTREKAEDDRRRRRAQKERARIERENAWYAPPQGSDQYEWFMGR